MKRGWNLSTLYEITMEQSQLAEELEHFYPSNDVCTIMLQHIWRWLTYVAGYQTKINQFKVLGLVNDCLLYKRNSLKMPSHFLQALTRKCEDHALCFRLYQCIKCSLIMEDWKASEQNLESSVSWSQFSTVRVTW